MQGQHLQKKAHDDAAEAGRKLADAEEKLQKAEKLLEEANIRMSNARKFEIVLMERQKKLDRAFVLLNKQKKSIQEREMKENERNLMIRENIANF